MRRFAHPAFWVALIAATSISVVAMMPDRGQAVGASVNITANVVSQTTFSPAGCPTAVGVTGFGNVTPGATYITPTDCTFSFGSSNSTSSLRIYQQDGSDDAMWRGTDGTLDTAFDGDAAAPGYPGNGLVRTGTNAEAYTAVTQPDGKVLAGGFYNLADEKFLLVRYNRDGTLDTSFDGDAAMPGYPGNGIVSTNIRSNAGAEQAFAIALQPDGKIVAAGRVEVAGDDDMAVVRYNADGTLDTSFDGDPTMPGYPGNGMVVRDIAGQFDEAHAVVVRPDGRIVLGGTGLRAGAADFALVKLNADGTSDLAFDGDPTMPIYPGNGEVSMPIGAAGDRGYAMVLQPDGNVVLGGVTDNGAQRNLAMARFAADGTLDTTFDGSASMPGYPGNGKVTTAYGSTTDNFFGGLALQGDGKLVQSGSLLAGTSATVVARYNADGSLDTAFDGDTAMPGYPGDGVVRTTMTSGLFTTHDVLLTPDDRIVVVADQDGASDGVVVNVYRSDGTLDTGFSTDGKDVLNPSAGDDAGRGVTVGIDGRLVVVGHYNSSTLLAATYDTVRIPDWNSGVNDWTTAAFATCLSSTTGGAGWTPTAGCPAGTASAWHAVPDNSGSAANVIATSPLGVTNTTASLRFGFRALATQRPGLYVAPVVVELIAP
ncbi:MAG: Hemolysin-type calcium-binding region [Thermoleophilia bacterium]|nr:Hemolysin-type calcium-binding region [Thermoleophilia bacterium]